MEELYKLIRQFEGLHKLKNDGLVYEYVCPAGVRTIGYGTTRFPKDVHVITKDQAESWMQEEADQCLRSALKLSPCLNKESNKKQAAIADFIYNLGSGAYKSSTLKKKVDACDWEAAAYQIRKWVWGGGKKLPGLIIRRELEAQLLLDD